MKKTAFCLLTIFFGTTILCFGQSKNIDPDLYKASTIPDSLKENANSVVRFSTESTTVKAAGKAASTVHRVVTILNEKGKDEAVLFIPYQRKFNSVSGEGMTVFDADGKILKKYHRSDMYDRSASDFETIASDERFLYLEHTITSYPVTIETTYDINQTSLIDLGSWQIKRYRQSVQNSYCSFNVSPNLGFRYTNKNINIKPSKSAVDGFEGYLWEVKNLKAVKAETGELNWKVLPKILFATNQFNYYNLPGDFSSWQNFGKWIHELNADVSSLPPDRVSEINQMTAGLQNDKEKARFLYAYLQKNTRYISVQLGIGGLKPFAAGFVDQKKYGDCKALSNYMYALLKAVNIPAYYAIINAGTNAEPADEAFPYNSFNHVILCIPFKNDTTWLECTSNTQPFGILGAFTENRKALLITENGGKLVNTPKSTFGENKFKSEAHLTLNADGSASSEIKLFTTGEFRQSLIWSEYEKVDDQKTRMIDFLNLRQPNSLELKPQRDTDGEKSVSVLLNYDKFYDVASADKQFYRPKVLDIWHTTLPPLENRKTDYFFDFPMEKTCITTIDLPQGYEVETLPANTSLKFTYGNFEANYVYDAAKNQVITATKFNVYNLAVPANKYAEMQQYFDNVLKAENKKLIIKKKA